MVATGRFTPTDRTRPWGPLELTIARLRLASLADWTSALPLRCSAKLACSRPALRGAERHCEQEDAREINGRDGQI